MQYLAASLSVVPTLLVHGVAKQVLAVWRIEAGLLVEGNLLL
jgi:hypothetical protein